MALPKHGTLARYLKGCNAGRNGDPCSKCRAVNAQHHRNARIRRSKGKSRSEPIHGRISTYVNHRCKCPKCKAAWAKYVRDYRASKVVTAS